MKNLSFLFTGTLFGIILTKSQAISWYRIYEMFRFESFHMYGIIGSTVVLGILTTLFFKKTGQKDINNEPITFNEKNKSIIRYLAGGIFFGLGWALVGACPGPLFALLGAGYYTIIIVIIGTTIGTFMYGLLRDKLPH